MPKARARSEQTTDFQLEDGGPTYTIHALGNEIWVTWMVRNHPHRSSAHILADPRGQTWLHIAGVVCFPCSVGIGAKE